MNREVPSVPFNEGDRPKEVLKGGTRLDGRGFEVFRNVCECLIPAFPFDYFILKSYIYCGHFGAAGNYSIPVLQS
jgi:hypothetical protein